MLQNKIAIIYDFDGTLTPKTMQEYTLLPKLGITSKNFWASIIKETKETGAETMMVYMRHLLDSAIEKNIQISKNEFYKMGKDIKYYQGVKEWFGNIDKYVEKKQRIEISADSKKTRIWLSSRTGEGVNLLLETIIKHLGQFKKSRYINLPLSAGQLRAKLFDIGAVKQENADNVGGWLMEVELEEFKLHKLCREANLDISNIAVKRCPL